MSWFRFFGFQSIPLLHSFSDGRGKFCPIQDGGAGGWMAEVTFPCNFCPESVELKEVTSKSLGSLYSMEITLNVQLPGNKVLPKE